MSDSKSDILYERRFTKRFFFPMAAHDRLRGLLKETREAGINPEEEEVFVALCHQTVKDCCRIPDPNSEELGRFMDRLQEINDKANADIIKDGDRGPAKKSYGTDFVQMLQESSMDQLLLMLCDYNVEKADYLYSEVDRDHVDIMIDHYIKKEMEKHKINMEGCLYGFGGSYSGDSKSGSSSPAPSNNDDPSVQVFDLTESNDGLKGLQKMMKQSF